MEPPRAPVSDGSWSARVPKRPSQSWLVRGDACLEPASDYPAVPTAGPRDGARGGKVTFVLEKARRWDSEGWK